MHDREVNLYNPPAVPPRVNKDNAQGQCAHFCPNALSSELHHFELAAKSVTFYKVFHIDEYTVV